METLEQIEEKKKNKVKKRKPKKKKKNERRPAPAQPAIVEYNLISDEGEPAKEDEVNYELRLN